MELDPSSFDIAQHPLMRDAAILPTPAVELFVNAIRTWLELLLPGGIVWGNFRTGKTQAIRYFLNNSYELLGLRIPTYFLSAWDPDGHAVTENRFYSEMLSVLGYGLTYKGTGLIKRRRAIDFVVDEVGRQKEHRALLFVDEAQWLNTRMYRFLMDFHNQLKRANVRLVVVLVGQPEILETREEMRGLRQGHIIGRFMTATHQFKGAQLEDLECMALAMDQTSEYPAGTGCKYTQFFLPKAYQAGWRLKDNIPRIWEILTATCSANGVPEFTELPMQGISAMLRALMQEFRQLDCPTFAVPEGVVRKVIETVALQQFHDHIVQVADRATSRTQFG